MLLFAIVFSLTISFLFLKALPSIIKRAGKSAAGKARERARKVKRGADLFKDEFDEFWGKTNL